MAVEIIELKSNQLHLLAKILHRYALDTVDKEMKKLAEATIYDLYMQTSIVKVDPYEHLPRSIVDKAREIKEEGLILPNDG